MSAESIARGRTADPELTAQERHTAEASEDYDADERQAPADADHIRQRPGMYIGDTGTNGLHHLVYELVHNSVDEALAGYCKNIHVKSARRRQLSASATTAAASPSRIHPEDGMSTLEVVMTTVGAGAKFDKGTYKVSAGLHGMGAKAVTALSEWAEAEVQRNGRIYSQEYERGKATTEVKDIGAAASAPARASPSSPTRRSSTTSTFDYDTLEGRLRELAFLNKGLAIRLTDERTGKEETFKYDGGIAEFVEYLNRAEDVLHKPIYIDKTARRRPRRGGHAVHDRRGGAHAAATPTTPTTPRRHAPDRLPRGPDAHPERLRQQGGPVQERHAHRRGLPRGADGHHQRAARPSRSSSRRRRSS